MIRLNGFPQGSLTCEQIKAKLLKLEDRTLPLYVSMDLTDPAHDYEAVRCFRTQTWYPGSAYEQSALVLYTVSAAVLLPQFYIPLDDYDYSDANDLLAVLENKTVQTVDPSWPVVAAFVGEGHSWITPIMKVQQRLFSEEHGVLLPRNCLSM